MDNIQMTDAVVYAVLALVCSIVLLTIVRAVFGGPTKTSEVEEKLAEAAQSKAGDEPRTCVVCELRPAVEPLPTLSLERTGRIRGVQALLSLPPLYRRSVPTATSLGTLEACASCARLGDAVLDTFLAVEVRGEQAELNGRIATSVAQMQSGGLIERIRSQLAPAEDVPVTATQVASVRSPLSSRLRAVSTGV